MTNLVASVVIGLRIRPSEVLDMTYAELALCAAALKKAGRA